MSLPYCFLPSFWKKCGFSHASRSLRQNVGYTSAVYVQYMRGHLGAYERKKQEKVIGWIIRAAVELNKEEMREV